MSKLAGVLIVLFSGAVFAACTTAEPAEVTHTAVDKTVSFAYPASWDTLGSRWKRDDVIAAYGNVQGGFNQQSIVVRKFASSFDSDRLQFDQSFCDSYFRLAHADDTYYNPPETFQPGASHFNNEKKRCEVSYTAQSELGNVVEYLDVVYVSGSNIYVVEASAVEGSDFVTIANIVRDYSSVAK